MGWVHGFGNLVTISVDFSNCDAPGSLRALPKSCVAPSTNANLLRGLLLIVIDNRSLLTEYSQKCTATLTTHRLTGNPPRSYLMVTATAMMWLRASENSTWNLHSHAGLATTVTSTWQELAHVTLRPRSRWITDCKTWPEICFSTAQRA